MRYASAIWHDLPGNSPVSHTLLKLEAGEEIEIKQFYTNEALDGIAWIDVNGIRVIEVISWGAYTSIDECHPISLRVKGPALIKAGCSPIYCMPWNLVITIGYEYIKGG